MTDQLSVDVSTNGSAEPTAETRELLRLAVGATFGTHDDGLAQRLVHYTAGELRYDKHRDQFYNWDGRRFNPSTHGDLVKITRGITDLVLREAQTLSDEGDGETPRVRHLKFAIKSKSRDRMAAMIELAKGFPELWISGEELDPDPYKLNFLNCTVDVRTWRTYPHDPADLITKLIPHGYAPDAVAPRWQQLLARVFRDAALRDDQLLPFVERLLGYAALGGNEEQLIVFNGGPEGCGKSKVIEIAAEVLGSDYTHKSKPDLISRKSRGHHDSERLSIEGTHLVYISETSSVFNLDEQGVKELTGDRRVTTRELYKGRERNAAVTWLIWLTVNAFPNVLEWDGALRRRVVCLPAGPTVPPAERDPALDQHILREEAEGVLAALVRGARSWYVELERSKALEGVETTGLPLPPSVLEANATYAREQDHIGQFIAENLQLSTRTRC